MAAVGLTREVLSVCTLESQTIQSYILLICPENNFKGYIHQRY